MATRKRERIIAIFFAALFIISSSSLGIALLINSIQTKQQDPGASSQQSNANTKEATTMLTGTKEQNYTPTATPISKLSYNDTKVGTGEEVKPGATITADYVGWLSTTGTIFDAASDHGGPATFPLSGVIAGWSQAIPGMKVGGTRRLFIPANLAYGTQGAGSSIPPNSDLVFDVTVTAVKQ